MSGEVAETPKYRLIADALRAAIRSGRYGPGDQLPGENALMAEYGVARMTARQALAALQAEGLTVTRRGAGVFVREFRPIIRESVSRLSRERWGSGRSVWEREAEGRALTPELLSVDREPSDELTATRLGIAAGSDVVVRRRRYLLDGRPVLISTSWLPADIAAGTPIAEADTGPGGTYARLADLGHAPEHFQEDVIARMATPEEANHLKITMGSPVVHVVRTALDGSARPVEVNDMTLDAGVYVLRYEFDA